MRKKLMFSRVTTNLTRKNTGTHDNDEQRVSALKAGVVGRCRMDVASRGEAFSSDVQD